MLEYFTKHKEKLLVYSSLLSEAPYKAKYGKGLKILTPKQILQRLLIAPAQGKAGNTF